MEEKNEQGRCLSVKAIAISIIAIIISTGSIIFSLCVRCNDKWDWDLYGSLIGILSFLVTLLLGWQIFQSVGIKGEVKKMEGIEKCINEKINNEFNNKSAQIKKDNEIFVIKKTRILENFVYMNTYISLFNNYRDSKDFTSALRCLLNALEYSFDESHKDKQKFILDNIIETINKNKNQIGKFYKGFIINYIETLKKIPGEDSTKIINFINKLKVSKWPE